MKIRISAGARPSNYIRWNAPVPRGHKGTFLLGGTLGASVVPLNKDELANASVGGTPTVNDAYLGLGNGAYLTTALAEEATMSILFLGKSTSTNSGADKPIYVGNYDATGKGLNLYANSNTATVAAVGVTPSGGGATVVRSAQITGLTTDLRLLLLTCTTTSIKVEDLISTASATTNFTAGDVRAPTANLMRIGDDYSTTFNGTSQATIATMWNVVLTNDEKAAAKAWATSLAASLGLTL